MITPQVLWFVAAQALGALIAGILADRWWKALLAVAAGVGFLFLSPVVPPDLFRPLVPLFAGAAVAGIAVLVLPLLMAGAARRTRALVAVIAAAAVHLTYLIFAIAGR